MVRSAFVQAAVSAWCSGANSALVAASPARTSTATAPWAAAGMKRGACRRSRMRAPMPRRSRPAQASTMASKSPASSLARRVLTLPRRSPMTRSGRCARSSACRRSDEVPTRAPKGSSSKPAKLLDTKASKGSARSSTAARAKPGSSSIGTSLSECTAASARSSSIATSSSFRNRPLPPISASGWSSTWSPRVVIGTSSTCSPGCASRSSAATCSVCHSASALSRVARRIFSIRPPPRGVSGVRAASAGSAG